MKTFINKVLAKENLTSQEMHQLMRQVMEGKASQEDLAQFLLALREKKPTVDEITGAAQALREFSIKIHAQDKTILDTCGTGGDKLGTFNISTASAFVVAGAGCIVAKHGNRSVSSRCGSADVLEALGINIQMDVSRLEECLEKAGIAFLFAQKLHPAMKHAAGVRKELGVETIFNILGPLTNPAQATHQVMGVYSDSLVEPMAHVLQNLGLKRALVVHGDDGLDEITTTTTTHAAEYFKDEVKIYTISPETYKIPLSKISDLKGGDAKENKKIIVKILVGEKGPKRDIVVLNAGYALYIAEMVKSVEEGIVLARHSIDSGKAVQKLELLVKITNQ
ncbi:MAG: anthranilate phosphoribosyltransferase [Candidatus Omnitrophica bacterium]|nr:anthranilate phosphoribosyltransferase [Candidatus Omnitrophota bacterium]